MSPPKRHHTIPRVYLKNFIDADERLTLFSKRLDRIIRPLPQKALTRWFYYSQPQGGQDNVEHGFETTLLHELEEQYPSLYEELTQGTCSSIELLFQTLAISRVRSPAFREVFELALADYVDGFVRALPKKQFPKPPQSIPDLWDKIFPAIDPHRSLHAMPHYMKHYMAGVTSCSFAVAIAPKGIEFLTSDNPVIWFENRYQLGSETIFPFTPTQNTRVFFPLNKRMTLVGRLRRNGESEFREGFMEATRPMVRSINEMQLACSWDATIGTESIPLVRKRHYSKLAPCMKVESFDPESNEYQLAPFTLAPMRDKLKFKRKS